MQDLGSEEEEQFILELFTWLSRFVEAFRVLLRRASPQEPEFQEPENAGLCVEWLLSQRPGLVSFIVSIASLTIVVIMIYLSNILSFHRVVGRGALDGKFSLVLSGNPRAPKKVLAAAKRDAATLELERLQQSGQRFLPNPAKIKGFVKKGVLAAFGKPSKDWLPEKLRDMMPEGSLLREQAFPPNSWQGDEYEPCDMEERFLSDPKQLRRATVRIDEILSFEYLCLSHPLTNFCL